MTYGDLTSPLALTPAATENGRPVLQRGYEVKIQDGGFVRKDIGTLDLLRGGEWGSVLVYPAPPGAAEGVGGLRIVMGYEGLAGQAQTLLFRSLALTGCILAVAVMTMWLLLRRFVAEPLRAYSATARRIAAGEPLRMPDLGNNELGQLGQAINGMAEILRHQASVDPLTGLYNLQHLTSRLEDMLRDAQSTGEPLALIVCDLDNLKPVNDALGHQAGDLLLKAVARHLLAWSGIGYTCWRTGGDEFVAVLPGVGGERAHEEATKLEQAINSTSITTAEGPVAVSVSIGVAVYPDDGTTGAVLLNIADLRMYNIKSKKPGHQVPTPAA
jgi:diguanylate cyclase (GGDEF)-like protein